MSTHKVVLLLGSNKNDRIKNLQTATTEILNIGCHILKKSEFIERKNQETRYCRKGGYWWHDVGLCS